MQPSFTTDIAGQLKAGLAGLFEVDDTTSHRLSPTTPPDELVRFRGRFLVPAEQAFEQVRAHFARLGYIPHFRREDGQEVVFAQQGTIDPQTGRAWVNVVLFLLTLLSVLLVGATYEPSDALINAVKAAGDDPLAQTAAQFGYALTHLNEGLPFAVSLLTILLFHEFGHYLMARYHKVAVSLPYFIPMPITAIGTMGAVIVQKEPFRNRKVLFDIGVAGPLAGLVVAIPILIYGLSISKIESISEMQALYGTLFQEGNSLLYLGLKYLVFGRFLPQGDADVFISPVAFAGWVGLLVTALNLLPAGQLDGGHVAYVLFGDRTRQLSMVVVGVLGGLGVLGLFLPMFGVTGLNLESWLLWAAMIYFLSRTHPPALDEITAIDPRRRALAWAMIVLFVLVFPPVPFSQS